MSDLLEDVSGLPFSECVGASSAGFDACPCISSGALTQSHRGHHDPVQALFPFDFMSKLRKNPQSTLEADGAIIFGHSLTLHWHWPDEGYPVKGDAPQGEATDSLQPVNSGSGSPTRSSQPVVTPASSGPQVDSSGSSASRANVKETGSPSFAATVSTQATSLSVQAEGASVAGPSEQQKKGRKRKGYTPDAIFSVARRVRR